MRTIIVLLSFLIATPSIIYAQTPDIFRKNTNTWFMLLPKAKMTDRISIATEIHIRRNDVMDEWMQFLFRPFVIYKTTENSGFAGGYTYIRNYPYHAGAVPLVMPEHNFWLQADLKNDFEKWSLSHRLRQEFRFVGTVDFDKGEWTREDFVYRNRFRYRLTAKIPLKTFASGKKLSFNAFDEIFFSQWDSFLPRNFNQNWIYGAIGYEFNEHVEIQAGAMHQWSLIASDTYERNINLVLNSFLNF